MNIKKAHKLCLEIVSKINKEIGWHIKNTKLFSISKKYNYKLGFKLMESNRDFIDEIHLKLLENDSKIKVIAYLISDMILVIKENKDYHSYLTLDCHSNVKNIKDLEYYVNVFNVTGKNGSLDFISETKEDKLKTMDQI